MIIVLDWKYEVGTDNMLDILHQFKVFDSLDDVVIEADISRSAVEKKLKKLRDKGLLISHRYKDNNFIWMIGKDAENKWNKWEAHQIAVHRQYPNLTEEEVQLVNPFEKDINKLMYFEKINKLLKCDKIEIPNELYEYIDRLWSNYDCKTNTRRL